MEHGTTQTASGPLGPSGDRQRMLDRERVVLDVVLELADTLTPAYDELELWSRLLDLGLPITGAIDGAVLIEIDGHLHLAASSSRRSEQAALIELEIEPGPACHAFHAAESVGVDWPAEASRRWPELTRATGPFGWTWVFATPLRRRERLVGSLAVFWADSARDRRRDEELLTGCADVATIAALQHRVIDELASTNEQLHRALDGRIIIEQAKGMVARAAGVDLVDALAVMRRYARSTNQRLRDVAAAIVTAEVDLATIFRRSAPPTTRG